MVLATFKDSLNELLKNGGLWIAVGLVGLIVITVVLLLVMNHKKK